MGELISGKVFWKVEIRKHRNDKVKIRTIYDLFINVQTSYFPQSSRTVAGFISHQDSCAF